MIRQLTTLSLAALVAGCAIQKAEQPLKPAFDSSRNPEWLSPDIYPNGASPEKEPVVRYGRYTLVSTQPDGCLVLAPHQLLIRHKHDGFLTDPDWPKRPSFIRLTAQ